MSSRNSKFEIRNSNILRVGWLVGILLAVGCSRQAADTGAAAPSPWPTATPPEKLLVLATFAPMYCFTKHVAGDLADVEMIVPPGVPSGKFEPGPDQVNRIMQADVVVENGFGFEPWMDKIEAQGLKPGAIRIIAARGTGPGIPGLPGDPDSPPSDVNFPPGQRTDPHVWIDPIMAIKEVQNIRDALMARDPAHANQYLANENQYEADLRDLDDEVGQMTVDIPKRNVICEDTTFLYFLSRYQFTVVNVETAPQLDSFVPHGEPVIVAAGQESMRHSLEGSMPGYGPSICPRPHGKRLGVGGFLRRDNSRERGRAAKRADAMSWFSFHFSDFALSFLGIIFEGIPFLLLGSLISGAVEAFVPSDMLTRWLPKNYAASIVVSALLGLVLPMCECASVVVIRRLIRKGVPLSCAITYMMAAPIVSPVVALSTYAAFRGQNPIEMTLLRLALGFLIAVGIGMLVRDFSPEKLLQPEMLNSPGHAAAHRLEHGGGGRRLRAEPHRERSERETVPRGPERDRRFHGRDLFLRGGRGNRLGLQYGGEPDPAGPSRHQPDALGGRHDGALLHAGDLQLDQRIHRRQFPHVSAGGEAGIHGLRPAL